MGKIFLKNMIFSAMAFGLLASPIFFVERAGVKSLSIQFPKEKGRDLASVPRAPQSKNCQIKTKWRYHCDENKENCLKDQKMTYLDCGVAQ